MTTDYKPTDIELEGAFIAIGPKPFYIGPEVTGRMSDCFLLSVGRPYVPRFWRRRRLRAVRPLVGRLTLCRSFWRWLDSAEGGAEYMIQGGKR